ncbi:hypothetical protein J6590_066612 [Homalodisca vitripennis]|nr:hypothetical protein J6590_066612 [Homalodisca vitripennis]
MSGKLMTMMLMCSVLLFVYIGNSRSSEMSGKLMTMMLMCSVLLFAYIGNSRSSEVAWRYCGRDLARALSTTCNSVLSDSDVGEADDDDADVFCSAVRLHWELPVLGSGLAVLR